MSDSEFHESAEKAGISVPNTLLYCDVFFPSVDGVVRTVHNYALRLSSAASEFTLVVPEEKGECPELSYRVVRAKSYVNPLLPSYSIPTGKIKDSDRALIESGKYQIIHSHSPFALGNAALKTGKKLGIPVVATFHSKYYDDALNVSGSRLVAETVRRKVLKYYSSVDAVWTVNSATADTLRDYGYKGKITVMENGCDINIPSNSLELIRAAAAKLGMPETGKYPRVLLYCGQMIWHKDIKLILDTFNILVSAGGNYRLFLVGTGYNEKEIKRYAEKLGLHDRAVFLGKITDRELLSGIYGLADLFFFPSRYDNAPLVIREAALMGTPSLLTAGSNAASDIRDGENGYTAEPDMLMMAARISDIFEFSDHRAVGQRARETLPVSWDRILLRATAEYNEIIERYKKEQR